jgi:DNA-binding transcriptional LysR family regulator
MATIDLNRVSVFVRVVEKKSFTAAAKDLRVPVSSVSRAVASLEEELGVRLLHRTTRKLSLTDPGEHFFGRMHTVISEAEDAARAITGFASEPAGVVRITAPPEIGAHELPRMIALILRKHPAIHVELKLTYNVVDLVAEGFDLAIRAGQLTDSSLVARKVADSALGIMAAPSYLARRGRPRALGDLAKHACLRYGSGRTSMPWRFSGPRGVESVTVSGPLVSDDMTFLRDAAVEGMGITILPLQLAAAQVKAKQLERILPRYSYPGGAIHLVWPSKNLVPARVVAVRELLAEQLARHFR